MKLPKVLRYTFWGLGVLAALAGVVGFLQGALGLTQPTISAYCNVGGFEERTYSSFEDCDQGLAPDIKRYGYVCGCRRTDGMFGLITSVTRWVM
jgi:hypothetical protein